MIAGTPTGVALSFVPFGLVFGAALTLRAVVMGECVATAVFGLSIRVQAAVIAGGRTALPARADVMHDGLDGYHATIGPSHRAAPLSAILIAASGDAPSRRPARLKQPSRSARTPRAPCGRESAAMLTFVLPKRVRNARIGTH